MARERRRAEPRRLGPTAALPCRHPPALSSSARARLPLPPPAAPLPPPAPPPPTAVASRAGDGRYRGEDRRAVQRHRRDLLLLDAHVPPRQRRRPAALHLPPLPRQRGDDLHRAHHHGQGRPPPPAHVHVGGHVLRLLHDLPHQHARRRLRLLPHAHVQRAGKPEARAPSSSPAPRAPRPEPELALSPSSKPSRRWWRWC